MLRNKDFHPGRKLAGMLLATAFFFFCACNTGSGGQVSKTAADPQAAAPAYDASLKKGIVIDTVVCSKDSKQTYALYLPSGYKPSKPYPCIYFFDAHARGSLPVRAYKDIAERYGFVLVGSNNSQNGVSWTETNGQVKTLMEDCTSRINMDAKRVYTSGFSGGSRVAASVALFNGGVAGVIGCAAGFPQLEQAPQSKFDYFGIAGDNDFNFTEMAQLDKGLEQSGFTHQLLMSSGIHGWPSARDFETALLWMQVNAMKEHLQVTNDTIVNLLQADLDKRIAAATLGKDWIAAHDLVSGAMLVLNGVKDAAAYSKRLAEIDNGGGYKDAVAAQGKLQEAEMAQQREVQQQFASKNEKWLTDKIKQLNQNAAHAKTPQEAQMNKRVLSFVEFMGYMFTDHALKTGEIAEADMGLRLFKMAGPHNPDHGYLAAIYYMQKNDSRQAIFSLNEAAELGYNEVAKLVSDPAFRALAGDEGFNKVVARVKENYLAK